MGIPLKQGFVISAEMIKSYVDGNLDKIKRQLEYGTYVPSLTSKSGSSIVYHNNTADKTNNKGSYIRAGQICIFKAQVKTNKGNTAGVDHYISLPFNAKGTYNGFNFGSVTFTGMNWSNGSGEITKDFSIKCSAVNNKISLPFSYLMTFPSFSSGVTITVDGWYLLP